MARQSAVLVPLFRDSAGELRLVLVLRAPGGIHGGQLGLPGGRWEPEDGSLLETALREAEEEIGLPRDASEVLAELEPLETVVSDYLVHPFLATIVPPPEWRPAEGEIVAVVTPTVSALAAADARGHREVTVDGRPEPLLVDSVGLEQDPPLWGFTLRLLDLLLPRLLAGEWEV
jgi:8-oxo-dGTP pyrophosphatase MutT (NUDIX family)